LEAVGVGGEPAKSEEEEPAADGTRASAAGEKELLQRAAPFVEAVVEEERGWSGQTGGGVVRRRGELLDGLCPEGVQDGWGVVCGGRGREAGEVEESEVVECATESAHGVGVVELGLP
jgi:hypothetical protein